MGKKQATKFFLKTLILSVKMKEHKKLKKLKEFKIFGRRILVGIQRESFQIIGTIMYRKVNINGKFSTVFFDGKLR